MKNFSRPGSDCWAAAKDGRSAAADVRTGQIAGGEKAAGGDEEVAAGAAGRRLRASATTLDLPSTCLMSEVNSVMAARWRDWRGLWASVDFRRAVVNGLWSVKTVKDLPSRKYLK